MMISAGHVVCMREKRNVYGIFLGKPERRKPVAKRRRKWESTGNNKNGF